MAEEKARDPTKPEIKPVNIPLAKIHDLPGSVFAPPSPKSLEALTSSIVLRGVQEPVILRQREDGDFQIVSGMCFLVMLSTGRPIGCYHTTKSPFLAENSG